MPILTNSTNGSTRPVTTRLSDSTRELVKAQAKLENRSVCNMLAVIVERYFMMISEPNPGRVESQPIVESFSRGPSEGVL